MQHATLLVQAEALERRDGYSHFADLTNGNARHSYVRRRAQQMLAVSGSTFRSIVTGATAAADDEDLPTQFVPQQLQPLNQSRIHRVKSTTALTSKFAAGEISC
jgi:hypothetical protein